MSKFCEKKKFKKLLDLKIYWVKHEKRKIGLQNCREILDSIEKVETLA